MLRSAFNLGRVGPSDRRKLIAGIHAQAHALRLDDDTRRELQQKLVGVASSKDMSLSQLTTVWNRLTVLAQDAGLAKPKRRRPGRDERQPAEPPTKEQLEKIEHLYDDIGVRPSADMMALCRRITGHPWPQSRAEANQLTEGLKAMLARGWRARGSAVPPLGPYEEEAKRASQSANTQEAEGTAAAVKGG